MSSPPRSSSHPSHRKGTPQPGVSARIIATALYSKVLDQNQPLDHLIDPSTGDISYRALFPRDRRLVHAIVATALRRHGEIGAVLGQLIEKKLPRRAGRLSRVLEIAAVQILFMEIADHAVVSVALEQVTADRDARHFKGLANAVLRRLAREKDTILNGLDAPRLNTPDWLWQRWTEVYGEAQTRRIAEAHLVEPGLDLSVKTNPHAWAERLGGLVLPTGSVRLVPSGPIDDLDGYADGEWWVQDAAAAMSPKLLGPLAGKHVADLCAAPGGKTATLALAGAKVTAVDVSEPRLARLRANLSRLQLTAETLTADILEWNPTDLFDAILLDAPCSATGTIRRHPDIARLKCLEDIHTLASLQQRMLDKAVDLLKPGGLLVYCTCSLEPEEGEVQFDRALTRHNLRLLPVDPDEIGGLTDAVTPAGTIRTFPGHLPSATPRLGGLDGFFIGRCQKS